MKQLICTIAFICHAIVAFSDPIEPLADYKLNRFQRTYDDGWSTGSGSNYIYMWDGRSVYLTVEGSGTLGFSGQGYRQEGNPSGSIRVMCDDWDSVIWSKTSQYSYEYEDAVIQISGEGLHTIVFQADNVHWYGNTGGYFYDVKWNDVTIPCNFGPYVAATPVILPGSGSVFDNSLTVVITNVSNRAKMYYTLDGSDPTTNSIPYKKFRLYGKATVKAIAYEENWTSSEIVVAEYAKGWHENPVISPSNGSVFQHSGQRVSIAWAGSNGVLRVTTDGGEPTSESAEYAGPFTIDETTTVKAKVFSDQYFDSAVVTATLTRVWLKVATPEIAAQTQFTGSKQKVVISCDTDGALVRYTTDGSDPNSYSMKYEMPFYVTDTTTVKAYATKADYTNSDIATQVVTKVWGIGDTMGKPDHAFATSGDAEFVRVEDATATLGESMKSGEIDNEQQSVLSTKVMGPGTLTFRWKASCEQDDEYEWDHAEFAVDGSVKANLNGITDWVTVSQRIEGEGEHTVTWTYKKDDVEAQGEDCLWVADYAWASDYTTTQTTDAPVPYAWMTEKWPDVVDEYESYESEAKKTAANPRFTVEQCYVAGLDPASATNEFTAAIEMIDGVPNVTWNPDLETERTYKIWGSTNLVNGGDWEWPTNALHRFFKVTVEMP